MILDVVVIVVVLASAIIAFFRGFIREILTIFGIVGGMVAAYIGGPLLIPMMSGWLGIVEGEEPQLLFNVLPYTYLAQGLSYMAIFIGFAIILSIFTHVIAESARSIGLGPLDRTLGVVFGLGRGVLLLGLLYLPFFYLINPEQKKEWFEGSKTVVYLEATSGMIAKMMPEGTEEQLKQSTEKAADMNDTRQKLQELDLLGGKKEDPQNADNPPEPIFPENKADGYNQEFRNKMDQLIEQSSEPAE